MSITMKDVRACLDPDEPDYARAVKLGPEALPFLKELVEGPDIGLASKAASLAGMIGGEQSMAVLEKAALSHEPVVRVAAASSIRNLKEEQAVKIMDLISNDADAGVRKVMLRSAAKFSSPQMVARIQKIADKDPEPFVREMAVKMIKKPG
jgi:HEAT repeat protein